MRSVGSLAATVVAITALGGPLLAMPAVAQSADEVVLRGVVRDELTGTGLNGARLRFAELRRGTLSLEGGGFEFQDVPVGVHTLTVEHYGFQSMEATIDVREGMSAFVLELSPNPVMLDGITVVGDRLALMETRLQSRRRAYPLTTRAFEQSELLRSPARDLLDFLNVETSLAPMACDRSRAGSWCILRRGRTIEPIVYIDEARVIGGLDQLSTYQPHDLYLVEVYSQGLEIRAYTHFFMERMAHRPMLLIPIGVGAP